MIDANDIEAKLRALGTKKEKPTRRVTYRLLGAAAALMLATSLYLIDQYVFPVVSRQAAIFGAPLGDGKTRVQFLYTKNRNCRILGVRFLLTGPTIHLLPFEATGPLMSRPVGRQLSRVFIIDVPQNEFIERGSVEVDHKCHWLWSHIGRLF